MILAAVIAHTLRRPSLLLQEPASLTARRLAPRFQPSGLFRLDVDLSGVVPDEAETYADLAEAFSRGPH